jgi:hypothetical protein
MQQAKRPTFTAPCEIQNVKIGKGDTISIDWIFQAVKSCDSLGAQALFTGNVGRRTEVLALALVGLTSPQQVSQLHKRSTFQSIVSLS